jgi:signal transduction histidine kinase
MNHRAATPLAWSVFGLTLALWVAALWLRSAADVGAPLDRAIAAVTFMSMATGAALVASRRPESPFGWIMGLYGVLAGIDAASIGYGAWSGNAAAAWIGTWIGLVAGALITLTLLVVPNGHLPSKWWRPVVWLLAAAALAGGTSVALMPGPLALLPGQVNPVGLESAGDLLRGVASLARYGLLLAFVLSVLSLIARFRSSHGEQRQQLRWIAGGASAWVLATLLLRVAQPEWYPAAGFAYLFAQAAFVAAVAVAMSRYHLYDLDLVVNKAIVYGALAAFISGVYVAVVFGINAAIDATDVFDVWLSLLATVIVAFAFQPVRERAQRLANRLVYGHRASPYEVLAEFSRGLAGALTIDEIPSRTAEAAARGVGAVHGRVRVYGPEGVDRVTGWPDVETVQPYVGTMPVLHQGGLVGEIAVAKAVARLTPAENRLLADLAAQAGPALYNVRLAIELRAQATELRASRQRIVAAQDAERRRLERDIHDGAQQHLVAMAVNARMARELVRSEPGEAEGLLEDVCTQANDALGTLRDLARGIYPPVLVDRGLASAVEAHLMLVCPTARLELDSAIAHARYTPEVEAAAYFCCLEALQNCAKHAPGAAITVSFEQNATGWLEFQIIDRGPGFEFTSQRAGTGHQNMADRMAALDGSLEVRSTPGVGTMVLGRLPIQSTDVGHRASAAVSPAPA